MYMIVGGIAWLSMAALGGWIAVQRRRPESEGVILGLLFGPLGALIEAMMPTGDTRPIKTVEPVSHAAWKRQRLIGLAVMVGIMACGYVASLIFAG